MNKVALITGITGQDGSYLAEYLLELGYEVHGIVRRASSFNTQRIDHIFDKLHLHYGDLTDSLNVTRIIQEVRPDEIYNLGAMSHVAVSFEEPEYVAQCDGVGTLRILEAVRFCGLTEKTRIYQASTSELYGLVQETPQKETTPFYPRSPYAVAKLYAFWITKNYREAYGMYACNGILFNHESERRGGTFVTKKITDGVAKIADQIAKRTDITPLHLGNMSSKRDWGYAKDYVVAMHKMLQQDKPDDFVIATGFTTTVLDFLKMSFMCACDSAEVERPQWFEVTGEGTMHQKVYARWSGDNEDYSILIAESVEKYFRPAEVDLLLGDASKAEKVLGWKADRGIDVLVQIMVEDSYKRLQQSEQ